jgi:D-lactate dehydrogenase (cytochrome)
MPITIVGHVGDGNFHLIILIDPDSAAERHEAEEINTRLVHRAQAMDGTCTGEHGIGLGKKEFLRRELGNSVDLMATIKSSIDPFNLMNPGKIF